MIDYCQMCGQFHPLTTGRCMAAQNRSALPSPGVAAVEALYANQGLAALERELAAERIENTRLREAFVTMEKAYIEATSLVEWALPICEEYYETHRKARSKDSDEMLDRLSAWARREP